MLREISERAEIKIICSTGYYYEAEGAPAYFKFRQGLGSAPGEIEEMMMTEITSGIGGTEIKAGVIKLASSKEAITDYEKMFFDAGVKAQMETSIPIITHTQEGTMGPEQAEMLVGASVDPNRTMIGHMDGNTDVSYHIATLAHSVNIAFDRFGIQGIVGAPIDEMRQTCLIGLLGRGYGDRIALPRHRQRLAGASASPPRRRRGATRQLAHNPPLRQRRPRHEERRDLRRTDRRYLYREPKEDLRRLTNRRAGICSRLYAVSPAYYSSCTVSGNEYRRRPWKRG